MWLKDGDRNSKFYHQKASFWKRRNTVKEIEDEEGRMCTKKEEICEVINRYYQNMFKKEEDHCDSNVVSAIDRRVTPEMNEALMKPFTAAEIVGAIKRCAEYS